MYKVNIINTTPHEVVVLLEDRKIIYPKAETPVRVLSIKREEKVINGIPVRQTLFGKVIGLPKFHKNIFYIVSRMIVNACPSRTDLLIPAATIRDENNNIIACKGFKLS